MYARPPDLTANKVVSDERNLLGEYSISRVLINGLARVGGNDAVAQWGPSPPSIEVYTIQQWVLCVCSVDGTDDTSP